MKIGIIITNGTFWLAGEGQLSPDSLRVNGRRVVQIAALIRAEASKTFNRKNTVTTITFSVTREHDSLRLAEEYLIKHEAEIPSSGIVECICHDQGGAESSFYLDTGFLETTEAYSAGVSTFHSYCLVGGRITITKPT